MAPINLATLGEFASQLTREFGDRDSQILRLEEENARLRALEAENARLRAFEVENARLRTLEVETAHLRTFEVEVVNLRTLEVENARFRALGGENARLRALLDAATASSNPSNPSNPSTITTATLGLESHSRSVANEDRRQSEKSLSEVDGGLPPRFPGVASGKVNINRGKGNLSRRQDWSSDDDEDPIPVPKKEKAPVAAAAKSAVTRTSILEAAAGANRREPSGILLPVPRPIMRLPQVRAIKPKRDHRLPTLDDSASQENEARPAKRSRPAPSMEQREVPAKKQTATKKHTHPPHVYAPLQDSPFNTSRHASPPPAPRKKQQSSSFRYPGSSGISGSDRTNNPTRPSEPTRPKQKKKQSKPPAHTAAKAASKTAAATKPTSAYTEITPFTFKFIVSYATNLTFDETPEILLHDSASLTDSMSSFWTLLASLRNKWEAKAGAEWAWDVQKKIKTRGKGRRGGTSKRLCVTSKLAGRPTKWRLGDVGFWACLECAEAARPCFTWAKDENGDSGDEGEDGEEFCSPKEDFWCLPVHPADRKCADAVGKEIRTWVNEEESSGDEDDSGGESEESGSGAAEEYDDDDSNLESAVSSGETSGGY
jgi:hypothetical protein